MKAAVVTDYRQVVDALLDGQMDIAVYTAGTNRSWCHVVFLPSQTTKAVVERSLSGDSIQPPTLFNKPELMGRFAPGRRPLVYLVQMRPDYALKLLGEKLHQEIEIGKPLISSAPGH